MNGCCKLKVEHVVGENTAPINVQDCFMVPEKKPCIEKILSIDKTVKVSNVEVIKDRVILNGKLNLQVVYVAALPDQPVHHTYAKLDFSHVMEIPGAEPGMKARVKVKVTDLKGKVDPDDAGKYEITGVLSITVKVTDTEELNLMVDPPVELNAEIALLSVEEIVCEGKSDTIVSSKLKVPPEKPEIEKVLDMEVVPAIARKEVMTDQVMVEGDLQCHMLYVALQASQPVHHMYHMMHFTKMLDLPGAKPGMHVQVDPQIMHIGCDHMDRKTVSVDAIMEMQTQVTQPKEMVVVTDLPGMDSEKKLLRVDSVVGEEQSQVVVKEPVDVPCEKPGVEKILEVKVEKVMIPEGDIVIIKDKVILSGMVDCQVVYVSNDLDQSVHCMDASLKFRNFISVAGARPDQQVMVQSMVEHASARVDECGRVVTPELVIKVTARVTDPLQLEVVLCPEPPVPLPQPQPNCPFKYLVQPGDTLWLLSRQYHVSVESLLNCNLGIDPDNLKIGSELIIPCDP